MFPFISKLCVPMCVSTMGTQRGTRRLNYKFLYGRNDFLDFSIGCVNA